MLTRGKNTHEANTNFVLMADYGNRCIAGSTTCTCMYCVAPPPAIACLLAMSNGTELRMQSTSRILYTEMDLPTHMVCLSVTWLVHSRTTPYMYYLCHRVFPRHYMYIYKRTAEGRVTPQRVHSTGEIRHYDGEFLPEYNDFKA